MAKVADGLRRDIQRRGGGEDQLHISWHQSPDHCVGKRICYFVIHESPCPSDRPLAQPCWARGHCQTKYVIAKQNMITNPFHCTTTLVQPTSGNIITNPWQHNMGAMLTRRIKRAGQATVVMHIVPESPNPWSLKFPSTFNWGGLVGTSTLDTHSAMGSLPFMSLGAKLGWKEYTANMAKTRENKKWRWRRRIVLEDMEELYGILYGIV